MVVDVEVVEVALLDPAQGVELRQHRRRRADRASHLEALDGTIADERQPQLREHTLGRHVDQRSCRVGGQAQRVLISGEAELGGHARQPQHAQGVGGERIRADAAQVPRLEVGDTAAGVDQLAVSRRQFPRDRVDREVAPAQILLQRLPHQRCQIDLPVLLVCAHTPGAELA